MKTGYIDLSTALSSLLLNHHPWKGLARSLPMLRHLFITKKLQNIFRPCRMVSSSAGDAGVMIVSRARSEACRACLGPAAHKTPAVVLSSRKKPASTALSATSVDPAADAPAQPGRAKELRSRASACVPEE